MHYHFSATDFLNALFPRRTKRRRIQRCRRQCAAFWGRQ